MLDIMFELPDQPRGNRYVITEDVVDGRQAAVRPAADEECLAHGDRPRQSTKSETSISPG